MFCVLGVQARSGKQGIYPEYCRNRTGHCAHPLPPTTMATALAHKLRERIYLPLEQALCLHGHCQTWSLWKNEVTPSYLESRCPRFHGPEKHHLCLGPPNKSSSSLRELLRAMELSTAGPFCVVHLHLALGATRPLVPAFSAHIESTAELKVLVQTRPK